MKARSFFCAVVIATILLALTAWLKDIEAREVEQLQNSSNFS